MANVSNSIPSQIIGLYCPIFERLMDSTKGPITDADREAYESHVHETSEAMRPLIDQITENLRLTPYLRLYHRCVTAHFSPHTTFAPHQRIHHAPQANNFDRLPHSLRHSIFKFLSAKDIVKGAATYHEWQELSQEMSPYIQREFCRDVVTLCHRAARRLGGLNIAVLLDPLVDMSLWQRSRTLQECHWNLEQLKRKLTSHLVNKLSNAELSTVVNEFDLGYSSLLFQGLQKSIEIIKQVNNIYRDIVPRAHESPLSDRINAKRIRAVIACADKLVREEGRIGEPLGLLDHTFHIVSLPERNMEHLRRLVHVSKDTNIEFLMDHHSVLAKELIYHEAGHCIEENEPLWFAYLVTRLDCSNQFKEQVLTILFHQSLRGSPTIALEIAKLKKENQMECFDALLAQCDKEGNNELYNRIIDYLHTPR